MNVNKPFFIIPILAVGIMVGCSTEDESTSNSGGGGSSGGRPDQQQIDLRIRNDQISFNEGAQGEVQMNSINFALSGQTGDEAKVTFQLTDGTAIAGEHYTYEGDSYTLTIPSNSQGFAVNLGIVGNDEYNEDRYFTLQFTEAQGINLPDNAVVRVNITNNDPLPKVEFDRELVTVSPDIGSLTVQLKQDRLSSLDSHVNLDFSGLAARGSRYRVGLDSDSAVIPAGETEFTFELEIVDDGIPRGNTNIVAELTSAKNSEVNEQNILTIIAQGRLGLPDTGVTYYYNDGDYSATAPGSEYLYQDADYGHDVDFNPESPNGYASLSYTKLDLSGNPMPDTSDNYHCVQDRTTGLVWERKMATPEGERITSESFSQDYSDRAFFRYVNDQYMWRNTDRSRNGGNEGGSSQSDLTGGYISESSGGHCMLPAGQHQYATNIRNGCTTEAYLTALNNSGACGFSDWRAPHISELSTLGVYDGPAKRMDAKFLLDPMPAIVRDEEALRYWSDTPSADNSSSAWCFDLATGARMLCQKNAYFRLIAVRGGE